MIMLLPIPQAEVALVAKGEAETLELARLRAYRALLLPFGATVFSNFQETSSYRRSQIQETHEVQVNFNDFHGIQILSEVHTKNTWVVSVRLNPYEAIKYLEASIRLHMEGLKRLQALPKNRNREITRKRIEELLEGELGAKDLLQKQVAKFR